MNLLGRQPSKQSIHPQRSAANQTNVLLSPLITVLLQLPPVYQSFKSLLPEDDDVDCRICIENVPMGEAVVDVP